MLYIYVCMAPPVIVIGVNKQHIIGVHPQHLALLTSQAHCLPADERHRPTFGMDERQTKTNLDIAEEHRLIWQTVTSTTVAHSSAQFFSFCLHYRLHAETYFPLTLQTLGYMPNVHGIANKRGETARDGSLRTICHETANWLALRPEFWINENKCSALRETGHFIGME